mmetsp:Transcript_54285/g.101765  ORF Transcript_54285/g.101765 Transcript_54285/m.101765 type:complete len:207 (-) Transcript_54285:172-792(-)
MASSNKPVRGSGEACSPSEGAGPGDDAGKGEPIGALSGSARASTSMESSNVLGDIEAADVAGGSFSGLTVPLEGRSPPHGVPATAWGNPVDVFSAEEERCPDVCTGVADAGVTPGHAKAPGPASQLKSNCPASSLPLLRCLRGLSRLTAPSPSAPKPGLASSSLDQRPPLPRSSFGSIKTRERCGGDARTSGWLLETPSRFSSSSS